MKFNIALDRDEDGIWIAECFSIPGCVSQGKTKDEALINIKDAIKECLEVRSELGYPLTVDEKIEIAEAKVEYNSGETIQYNLGG